MGLTWWPVAAAGLCALVAVVVLTFVLPLARARRRLRPLAHVDRLTGLPEYARIRQREIVSAAITLALLVILFGTAVLTAARPSGSDRDFEALHPEDIMLCVADPVTEDTTAQFLDYYARQSATFDTQRIGLTSTTVRVLPLTRDHSVATTRLSDHAALSRPGVFSRPVDYADYATNLRDTLALCMTGFGTPPSLGQHRRSLIYLGPSTFGAADQRALFTDQQITDMASKAGVQINAVAKVDVTDAARRGDDLLATLAARTGGRFVRYHAAGPGGSDPTLAGDLDLIGANPAPLVLPGGARITGQHPDDPVAVLIVALAAGTLLCLSLAVARR